MDNLRELLKETENLVEDLQKGLEMKDSMRVKKLHNQNYGSQGTYDHSLCDKELNGFSPEKHMDNFPITDCKKSYGQKEEESSESMSKIEAELEAELERLGLNMNEPDQERPQSELVEVSKIVYLLHFLVLVIRSYRHISFSWNISVEICFII